MNSDLVSLIVDNKNEIVKLQRMVGCKAPMTTKLDMGGYRNVVQPRDPREYESDLVTSKILYDYMSKVDQNYMRRDRDGSLDGRLNMSNHRISGLADPTDADDAVTSRFVASRFQALSDEVQGIGDNLDALLNLLGVENNQVLIRKYELIDGDFEYFEHIGDVHADYNRRISGALFRKYSRPPDEIIDFEFFDILTLKENFIHLFEEPFDNFTWLRIKQPGTYTIHLDLFSFELHTRDEIIRFSEHNPKHDINLEKGENCLLVYKQTLKLLEQVQKYMFIIIYRNGTKTGIIIANSESKKRN